MPSRWLIENGTVATLGPSPRIIEKGAVLLEEGRITEVGPSAQLRRKAGSARRMDAEGKIVMSGFTCAHHHLYSSFARGMALPSFSPKNFLEILRGLWWKLDRKLDAEDIYWSALAAFVDCLKAGTTTVIDHHESQSFQLGSLDVLEEAVRDTGIRASLSLGVSDRYGRGREGIRENERFLKKWAGRSREMLSPMVGLHASFTVKDETLEACVDLAQHYGVGIHTHCAEDAADERHSTRVHRKRVVERFWKKSVLSPKAVLVHCVHVNEHETDLIAGSGAAVVHNPESNMNNAVGAADILKLMKKGVTVGLGTDGMSSHMPSQARTAYLLQRHLHRNPRVALGEALTMLLSSNAAIASRLFDVRLGTLSPGAAGDVIVLDYRPPTPLTSINFGGHLLFGMAYASVDTVFVAGRLRLRHRRLVDLDEDRIMARSREQARRFWKKMLNG